MAVAAFMLLRRRGLKSDLWSAKMAGTGWAAADQHARRVREMIELFTAATPNGWKVSITLEEMDLDYTVRPIALSQSEQRQAWYLKLNPNGRIPTIVDQGNDTFVVFESGAILIYLAERTGRLMPHDQEGRSRVIQWLMFQMGGIGPMLGRASVFYRYAPERIEFAINRYQREGRRLFEVLDRHLQNHEYLAGEYSIADIANWSWVHEYEWPGVSVEGLPHLQRWLDTIAERPAVIRGKAVPEPIDLEADAEKLIQEGQKMLT